MLILLKLEAFLRQKIFIVQKAIEDKGIEVIQKIFILVKSFVVVFPD